MLIGADRSLLPGPSSKEAPGGISYLPWVTRLRGRVSGPAPTATRAGFPGDQMPGRGRCWATRPPRAGGPVAHIGAHRARPRREARGGHRGRAPGERPRRAGRRGARGARRCGPGQAGRRAGGPRRRRRAGRSLHRLPAPPSRSRSALQLGARPPAPCAARPLSSLARSLALGPPMRM